MAHTKAQRAVKGNRDSRSKRRGVKLFGGQLAVAGNIIVKQVGSRFRASNGTIMAKDFSIHAMKDGIVRFFERRGRKFITVE